MYIRVKTTPLSPRKSVQIVEGMRIGNKVKQKIVKHVGIAGNADEEKMLYNMAIDIMATMQKEIEDADPQLKLFDITKDEIKESIKNRLGRKNKKRLEEIIPVNEVKLSEIIEKDRIVEGIHEVGGVVYNSLGYGNILSKRNDKILQDFVLAGLSQTASKRGTQKNLIEKFGKEHNLDAVYRMMDKLYLRIGEIKRCTFNRTRSLFPERASLLLFDVTTLYFESTEVDDLRNFGYSKDCRFNTTQVVLALATNEQGLPIGYELFEGNKAEVKTLVEAIDSWKELFNIDSVCFVGDRAMFSKNNLAILEERGYDYIVAAKLRSLPKYKKEDLLDDANYKTTVLKNELAWIGEFEHENKRLIVSYKTKRAINDAKERKKMLDKINKLIGEKGPTRKLINNNAVKKFTITDANSKTVIDENKIAEDMEWDGLHGVITNIKSVDANEILGRYAQLWVIEESFRINKHLLKMRPIFHWKPERIHAHIAMKYMSFAIARHMEYRVMLTQKISPEIILEELSGVQASIYAHKKTGDLYRVPGKFSNSARKIYKAFNIERNLDAVPYI